MSSIPSVLSAIAKLARPRVAEPSRTSRSRELMARFSISPATVTLWIRRGAPHDRVHLPLRRGGEPARRGTYLFDLDEVARWLKGQIAREAHFAEKHLPRIAAEEARPRLLEIKEKLRLTTEAFAELLEVEYDALRGWIGSGKPSKTVPEDVLTRASFLLESEEPRPTKFMGHVSASKEDLARALEDSLGVRSEAARALGISASAVTTLANLYGLKYAESLPLEGGPRGDEERPQARGAPPRDLRAERPSPDPAVRLEGEVGPLPKKRAALERDELATALVASSGDRQDAARRLGVHRETVSRAARRFALERLLVHRRRARAESWAAESVA